MQPTRTGFCRLAFAVVVTAAGTCAAVAADGGWCGDAPGVSHHLTPDTLSAPFASRSVSRGPSVVPAPPNATLAVPTGFRAIRMVGGLDMPRTLRTAPNGDIFIAESGAGQIRILPSRALTAPTGSQPAGLPVFAADLSLPFGIAFWPPGPNPTYVYVAETSRVVRFAYRNGMIRASGLPEVVVASLPEGGHWTRDLAVSPDGQTLFVSVGSASNMADEMSATPPPGWQAEHPLGAAWGDEQDRATVIAFDPTGGHRRIFATGLRNCSGMAMQPGTGAVWCAVNERDGLGDDLPPDYATPVHEGAFYGWPWFYLGAHADPRLAGRRDDLAGRVTVPEVLIQSHSAPLGMAFLGSGGQFPSAFWGDAFVALHGSWNREQRSGYKIVRLRFRAGRATGEYEDFVTGFVTPAGDVWGRPVGVTLANDGSLLFSEDGNGTIWRVSYAR